MTAVKANPRVSELRELFRHLNAFRAVFADHGVEDLTTPEGTSWSIWDLEYLHDQLCRLRPRQRQAITLCLIHNMRERDAAVAMGVSPTNPVMMYATLGLQRLLDMVDNGELDRYHERPVPVAERAALHHEQGQKMVDGILACSRRMDNGCLLYPNPGSGLPRILLRSPRFTSGFKIISPLRMLFQARYGSIEDTTKLVHTQVVPPFSRSCIEPSHHDMIVQVGVHEYTIRSEVSQKETA